MNNFWRRFIAEYIPKLIAAGRSKWQKKETQVKKDDIVLIVENNIPRGKWNLSWALEVFPVTDGIVRNARVKTENGELKRSVQKCCISLPGMCPYQLESDKKQTRFSEIGSVLCCLCASESVSVRLGGDDCFHEIGNNTC